MMLWSSQDGLTASYTQAFEAVAKIEGVDLFEDKGTLIVQSASLRATSPIDAALRYRLERSEHELLLRACGGWKTLQNQSVIDATGGWGTDACLLALHCQNLTVIERHPALACWLSARLQALCHLFHPQAAIRVLWAESTELSCHADVVYLDPMFEVKRSSKNHQGMDFLQQQEHAMAASSEDWLSWATRCAQKRIVFKRHRRAPADRHVNCQFMAKAHRFDIYLP